MKRNPTPEQIAARVPRGTRPGLSSDAPGYDWKLMGFDPGKPMETAFRKDCTPEDAQWWFEKMGMREACDRFEEMKRLHAVDMASRPWIVRAFARLARLFRRRHAVTYRLATGNDMIASARAMSGPQLDGDHAVGDGALVNMPILKIDGWQITCEDEGDDDCPKRVWIAVRGNERHELDLSPYSRPSHEVLRAHVALGFPSRTDFGLIGPISDGTILSAYCRERAMETERRLTGIQK